MSQDYTQFFAQNNRLHPEVKKKFLQNLRSGKFQQCFGISCQRPDPNKPDLQFCAYGVLLETLAQLHFPLTKSESQNLPYRSEARRVYFSYQDQDYITDQFIKDVGIGNLSFNLAILNDQHRLTFDQIADKIEPIL